MTTDRTHGLRVPFGVVALLTAYNVLVNEVIAAKYHGVVAAGAAATLFMLANSAGMTREELGLARTTFRHGVRVGVLVSVPVMLVVIALAAIPATQGQFSESSLIDMSEASLAWEVLVRIPLVTAGFEEFAFRGVLLASLARCMSWRGAIATQAALFGIWHILPTADATTPVSDVAVAVAFTAVAGVVFGVLAMRTKSIAAPFMLHAVNNGATLTSAWLVTNHLA